MARALLVLAVLVPVSGTADEVILRSGGRVSGIVVERTDTSITLSVGPGRITLPVRSVIGIREGGTALAEYRRRASSLAPEDLEGWLALALWSRERHLETQSREAFGQVLRLDPDHPLAHQALGHVQLGDRWMSRQEALRAQGYVLFESAWVTPTEREAILRERSEAAAAARARAEAEARVREAEARARAAEAEARRAELALEAAEQQPDGIAYPLVVIGQRPHRPCPPWPPLRRPFSPSPCWAGCGEKGITRVPGAILPEAAERD